jgi:hypothetical protein
LPNNRQGNLVSGRIPDIKKAGLSGRISGASLVFIYRYRYSFQVCSAPDYSQPQLVKAYHEAMRSFDILMKFYPEKVVAGNCLFFVINKITHRFVHYRCTYSVVDPDSLGVTDPPDPPGAQPYVDPDTEMMCRTRRRDVFGFLLVNN